TQTMLNISHNPVNQYVDLNKFKSAQNIFNKSYYKIFNKFLLAIAIIIFIVLFLPWTQNITGQGQVTTLKPNQRPQTIQSQIPARVEQLVVNDGDFVNDGDTSISISDINSEYVDDRVVERTTDHIIAKSSSVDAYQGKVEALGRQVNALLNEQ